MPEKPIKFGKYTLGETLGTGGFGTVYKASDPSGRTVAIKVLKPGWNDDPGAIERFRREAQVAGELFHSRIATIIDFDEADGRLYLVMRYIDGIPLNELIRQKGRLSWDETIQILGQVAEGLDYAHQRGLVHRDIKPANILVSEKDGAVITDFGLVKAADVSGMSTSGVMLGTPHYIAPEIWEGKPATAQTDIYSLACVAYEMLTGQLLFVGVSPPEVMTRHMQSAHSLSQNSSQGLPAGVRAVITTGVQRDLQKRYHNIQAFLSDLMKQKASLQQEVVAKAQAIARESESLIQRNELGKAREKMEALAELLPDSPLIAGLEQKIESMTRLNGVYGEAVEHYQAAQEKAQAILKENPAYPDAKGIFPRLGLRGGKPLPLAQPKTESVKPDKPVFGENLELRWQEKTMPYLLIILGLATSWLGVGVLGLVAGIGLFWRKNWARRTGMVFAGLLEIAGFVISVGMIVFMTNEISYFDALLSIPLSFGGCLLVILAFYLIQILGGHRFAQWTGAQAIRPPGVWKISVAYLATIIGILPAILVLVRKPAARIWAQGYAIFLMIALPIAGLIAGANMNFWKWNPWQDRYVYYGNDTAGQIWTAIAVIFFVTLSALAFRYLRSPKIRAYYENREV